MLRTKPKITVVDFMDTVKNEFEVEKGTKLLKALRDQGVDLVHTCGGKAKCTTCRVDIDVGTPTKETVAQKELFAKRVSRGLPQFSALTMFLSCQLLVEHDIEVSPMERYNFIIHDEGVGQDTTDEITPDPIWVDVEQD